MNLGESAVSEVVGAIILLAIAISIFSVIYMNVLSVKGPDPEAFVTIIGNVKGNNLILTHERGGSLSDYSVILDIDNKPKSIPIKDCTDTNPCLKDGWDIGEEVIIPLPLNVSNIRNYIPAKLDLIDKESNSIVFWGSLDVYPEADIGVNITADNLHPIIGSTINLTINVKNNQDDADAIYIEIQYLLPDSLQYRNYSTSRGVYNSDTGIWNISYLKSEETVSLIITVNYTGVSELAQLAMILDGSDSIDDNEWNLTIYGLANAVRNNMPHDSSVEFTVVQFADYILPDYAKIEVEPINITYKNYETIATQVQNIKHMRGKTPLAAGINKTTEALLPTHELYTRQIVCIVTDGIPNVPDPGAKGAAVAAIKNMKTTLKMDSEEDEIDALGIGDDALIQSLRTTIVWPKPGVDTWPPTKPGWVHAIDDFQEFSEAINKIFSEFFNNSCIINNVKIVAVTPKIDPNIENNNKELIFKV